MEIKKKKTRTSRGVASKNSSEVRGMRRAVTWGSWVGCWEAAWSSRRQTKIFKENT